MKRIDPWREKLLLRKRTKNNLKRKRLERPRRTHKQEREKLQRFRDKATLKEATRTIRAPEIIGLSRKKSHRALVMFIEKVKSNLILGGERVCLDFRRTKKLYPDGTLLLLAELESFSKESRRRLTCTYSLDELVNEALVHIGLFDALGKSPPRRPRLPDAVEWHVVRKEVTDLEAAGRILERVASDTDIASSLFVGIEEAATNVSQHAYIGARGDGFPQVSKSRPWWMFVRVNRDKTKLNVVLCDLGVGIPRTIKRHLRDTRSDASEGLSRALHISGLSIPNEGTLIHAAMESKRSRTGKGFRGKGLGQIRNVVSQIGNGGKLLVLSNSGGYMLTVDKDGNEKEESIRYGESIFSTVIYWQVPLMRGEA